MQSNDLKIHIETGSIYYNDTESIFDFTKNQQNNNYQNSIGGPLIQIRHSVVTDNYLAAEEIQNENWQYFIQRTIEVCKSKVLIRPHEEFLLSTIENVAIAKKAYETFYNIIEKNLYLTIKKFSVDEKEKIQKDFQNKYFAGEDSLTNLDSWI